jgi:hypothetical protein
MVYIWSYRNPPGSLLEDICHKNVLFNLRHAASAPQIAIDDLTIEAMGTALFKVTAVVSNHGYLPTNLSDVAIQNNVAKPVTLELELVGAELVMNPDNVKLGHLAGRNERRYGYSTWGQQWSPIAKKVEWLVKSSRTDASVTIVATSEKGGVARKSIDLARTQPN